MVYEIGLCFIIQIISSVIRKSGAINSNILTSFYVKECNAYL